MAFTRVKARAICNKTEFSLFENSLSTEIKSFNEKQLAQFIKRTRDVRNKNRDLYKRQTLTLKTKGKTGSAANIRTFEKAVLFEETLARYEKRAKDLKASPKKPAVKTVSAKTKTAPKAKTAKVILPKIKRSATRAKPKDGLKLLKRPLKSNAARKDISDLGSDGTTLNNFTSKQALYKNKKSQMEQALQTPIRGHIKASVRRAQGRKDSR
jgi:hypothetical protein